MDPHRDLFQGPRQLPRQAAAGHRVFHGGMDQVSANHRSCPDRRTDSHDIDALKSISATANTPSADDRGPVRQAGGAGYRDRQTGYRAQKCWRSSDTAVVRKRGGRDAVRLFRPLQYARIPVTNLATPSFDRGGRLVARCRRPGRRRWRRCRARRPAAAAAVLFRRLAEALLQRLDVVHQFDGLLLPMLYRRYGARLVAESGLVAVPVRIRLGRLVEHADDPRRCRRYGVKSRRCLP